MAALTDIKELMKRKEKEMYLVHLRALSHFNTQKKYFFQ